MTKYGKIVCGILQVPQNYPCSIELDGEKISNPTDEQYEAAGYLPVVETTPAEKEGKIAQAKYKVKDGQIVQSWTYVNAPVETPEELNENE